MSSTEEQLQQDCQEKQAANRWRHQNMGAVLERLYACAHKVNTCRQQAVLLCNIGRRSMQPGQKLLCKLECGRSLLQVQDNTA